MHVCIVHGFARLAQCANISLEELAREMGFVVSRKEVVEAGDGSVW